MLSDASTASATTLPSRSCTSRLVGSGGPRTRRLNWYSGQVALMGLWSVGAAGHDPCRSPVAGPWVLFGSPATLPAVGGACSAAGRALVRTLDRSFRRRPVARVGPGSKGPVRNRALDLWDVFGVGAAPFGAAGLGAALAH